MNGLPEMTIPKYSKENLEAIRAIVQAFPGAREGRMFGYPAFFVGRRMFACVYDVGVGVKLPAEDALSLLKREGNIPFRPHGKARMREWVQLNRAGPGDYLKETKVFERSVEFVKNK